MLLNSNSFQQRQIQTGIKHEKPFNHFSLRGTVWKLPSLNWATWHLGIFATLLLGSEDSCEDPTLPAAASGSMLEANLRRHLLLGRLRRSTCSVLSETICRIPNPSKTHTNKFTIPTMLLNPCNFQQTQINTRRKQEKPSTISLCEAPCEICLLQVEPLCTTNFFATPLLGSDYSQKSTLPAVSPGSTLEANLRLHLLLGCHCRSTCSVLPASIFRKHLGTTTSPGTIHLKPIQVNSNSYDNLTHRRKQENLQPILSARHPVKSAFFKFSHLAPRTFCHDAAGIWEQRLKTNSSRSDDWLKAWSKSAAPSAPWVSLSKHLQCFARINLSKTPWDYDKSRYNPS